MNTAMKPEQQRIKIAEACGWTDIRGETGYPSGVAKKLDNYFIIPDHLNDLNAMHEAEKVFYAKDGWHPANNWPWYYQYACELSKLGLTGEPPKVHATASQRAEAFLKTLNLWEE